jgi:hypothetical protein
MKTTHEALKSWQRDDDGVGYKLDLGNGYEICLEALIFDEQWYLAIYKDEKLIAPKVAVKVGKKEDYKKPIEVK